jgi:hypothetical protein
MGGLRGLKVLDYEVSLGFFYHWESGDWNHGEEVNLRLWV